MFVQISVSWAYTWKEIDVDISQLRTLQNEQCGMEYNDLIKIATIFKVMNPRDTMILFK